MINTARVVLLTVLMFVVAAPLALAESPAPNKLPITTLPMDTKSYDSALAIVQSDVILAASSKNDSGAQRHIALALKDLAPIVHRPVIDQTTMFYADNRPLRSVLTGAITGSGSKLHDTLEAVLEQITLIRVGTHSLPSSESASEAAQKARAILSENEFSSDPIAPPSALQRTLDSWGDSIGKLFKELFDRLHMRTPDFSGVHIDFALTKDIMMLICGVAATLVVYLLVRMLIDYVDRRSITYKNVVHSGLALNQEEELLINSRNYARILLLASQSADQGEYRNAYRLVYLATLVLLDSTGHLKIHRSRTNWEYLRLIERGGNIDLFELHQSLTSEFDRIWYGYAPTGASDYEGALSIFTSIKAIVQPIETSASKRKASV